MAATNNAVNITSAGIVVYDGAGSFTADTVTNHGVIVGGTSNTLASKVLTNGQLLIGNTGNDPSSATLTAGTGVSITNGVGAITINATGAGLTWTDTSGSFSVVVSNGYFLTAAAVPTLPPAPVEGDVCAFVVTAAATVTITGNTGQVIRLGNTASAAAGTCASGVIGNSIILVYRAVSTTWYAVASVGSWTIT